ncbi:aminotransferase class V-fold PLP-dependent enzyme [Aeoliella sp. ICT_H6.2]|uniref:Aminotransferase class V-fold PLP-dependent enzyme n=1 Tax=Aeoliella straminimaris TaxID=2954799 RepID=A0A9X2JHB3_9BACT|nr:aminotransferase class V-fold PLP-dependent enzyme [Aeoliella straminimaris]MCO6045880.1 aminotransferase class V-fold PLP-dependent enzyme [Aeoliella straminimaris]
MYPRLRIDITWRDLLRAVGYSLSPRRVEVDLGPESLVTLSVRSAFDLLLSALDLPSGSEVLLSEVTVPHMARIVREHDLLPVAVPIEPRTLTVHVDEVARRLTPRTRLLVVAHLYGSRMPLDEIGALCRERGVLLVEDCAQALATGTLTRHAAAAASLYSFGPIKTATALGGGVALVKDTTLRQQMQAISRQWPRQSTASYLMRVMKMGGLKLLSSRPLFSALVWLIDHTGGDADAFVGHSARGFPDESLFQHLRQQPCAALVRLMAHRLQHFNLAHIAERTERGRKLSDSLGENSYAAGCDNPTHTFWVFPLVCEQTDEVVQTLRRAGFDASQHSGLTVVDGDAPDHWFHRTVFVPHDQQVPEGQLAGCGDIVGRSQD